MENFLLHLCSFLSQNSMALTINSDILKYNIDSCMTNTIIILAYMYINTVMTVL